jgi:hypothetical protein
MPKKDFTPPRYAETEHYIFDKRTGEIVATATLWTIARRGERRESPTVKPELLRSLASQAGKRERDLDVLVVKKPRTERTVVRVDVTRGRLVTEKPAEGPTRDMGPSRLPGP